MPSIPLKQKFNGGEISPLLHGDPTFPKYGVSLRVCKNWLPITQGALVRRSGTVYINHTRNDAVVTTRGFIFPDGRSYILEFSDFTLRLIRNGAAVGAPYELATPWSAAMLPFLKFNQIGNVVTISYGGQLDSGVGLAPQDLLHTPGADSPWILVPTDFTPPVMSWFTPPHIQFSGGADFQAYNAGTTYVIGDRVKYLNQSWISIQNGNVGNAPASPSLFWSLANDAAHPTYDIIWAITAVVQDVNTGKAFETDIQAVATLSETLAPDRTIKLFFGSPSGASNKLLYLRVYRGFNGLGGVFGWMADVLPAGNQPWTDQGSAPDYSQQPPSDTSPFDVVGTNYYPAVVSNFDQRRLVARSSKLPQSIWASSQNSLIRFDRPTPGSDKDGAFFTLNSEILEEIRSIAPLHSCLLMTGQGEWTLRGSQGAAVNRTNVDLKRQSPWGSSWLDPLKIGNGVLFCTAKGNMVRDLNPSYGLGTESWDGDEISWQASHFLEHHTIVSWAFQTTPYSVAWLVRDDGLLISITYDRKRETLAWAQHPAAGGGAVENVAVTQEAPEDAVYLVVRRVINGVTVRYHERMRTPIRDADPRNWIYMDAAISFSDSVAAHIDDLVQLSGGTTYAAGTQALLSVGLGSTLAFTAGDAGTAAVIFNPDGTSVTARVVGFTDPTHVTVEFDNDLTPTQVAAWVAGQTSNFVIARSVFTVTHLNGQPLDSGDIQGARGVIALADGNVVVPTSLAGPTLTLPSPAVVVQVGIGYNSDMELLDAYHPSVEIRNKFKRVIRIGFHVTDFTSLWVGEDFTRLFEWRREDAPDSYGVIPATTGYFEEFVESDWNKEGRAVVRQWEPIPGQILSVLREMEIGGT